MPLLRNTMDDAAFALCLAAFAVALASAAVLSSFGVPEPSNEVTATASQPSTPGTLNGSRPAREG